MKIYTWLLTGTLIVPFLLFSQNVQPTATDADSSHHNLIAFDQGASQSQGQFIQFDEAPQLIKRVEPEYPATMLKKRWEAYVDLKVYVDINGNVFDVQLTTTRDFSGNVISQCPRIRDINGNIIDVQGADFVESAITAARQWKFKPAQKQGKPVVAWIKIPFDFKIFNGVSEQQKDDIFANETWGPMMKAVMCILKGDDYNEKIKPFINPEAYLIYGKYYENLHGVLNGEHKKVKLIEGPTSVAKLWQLRMSNDETTAIMVLKTQINTVGPTRFHTIIFMKSATGKWQIKHWHVSW